MGPIANYFLSVNLLAGDGNFTSIITNSDVPSAIANVYQTFGFSFYIYGNSSSGNKPLSNKYSITFSRENQSFWNNSGILNNIIAYTDSSFPTPNIEKDAFSYPSPYRYSQNVGSDLWIAFQSDVKSQNDLDFNVYTVDMQQVYSGKETIQKAYVKNSKNYYAFSWDALDNSKKQLGSGVYIFVIKIDSDVIKGKLVIFND
jgi:phosphoribosyl-AMP cyclohydrolase